MTTIISGNDLSHSIEIHSITFFPIGLEQNVISFGEKKRNYKRVILGKMYIIVIQIWFYVTRFRKDLCMCTLLIFLIGDDRSTKWGGKLSASL